MRMVSYLGPRALQLFELGITEQEAIEGSDSNHAEVKPAGKDHIFYQSTMGYMVDLFERYHGGRQWIDLHENKRKQVLLENYKGIIAKDGLQRRFRQQPLLPRLDFLRALSLFRVDDSINGRYLADTYVLAFTSNLFHRKSPEKPVAKREILKQAGSLMLEEWFKDSVDVMCALGHMTDVQYGYLLDLRSIDFSRVDRRTKVNMRTRVKEILPDVFSYTYGRTNQSGEGSELVNQSILGRNNVLKIRDLAPDDAIEYAAAPYDLEEVEQHLLLPYLSSLDTQISQDEVNSAEFDVEVSTANVTLTRTAPIFCMLFLMGKDSFTELVQKIPEHSQVAVANLLNDYHKYEKDDRQGSDIGRLAQNGMVKIATIQLNWLINHPNQSLPQDLEKLNLPPQKLTREEIKMYKQKIKDLSDSDVQFIVGTNPGEGHFPRPSALYVLYTRAKNKEERNIIFGHYKCRNNTKCNCYG